MSTNDWDEAARCFYNQDWKRLIEINEAKLKDEPNSEFLLWETADAYFNLDEYKRALEIGDRIHELYPDSPNAKDIIDRAKAALEKNVKQEI
jgi:tetratricopeptide (TPR) repeat protein